MDLMPKWRFGGDGRCDCGRRRLRGSRKAGGRGTIATVVGLGGIVIPPTCLCMPLLDHFAVLWNLDVNQIFQKFRLPAPFRKLEI